MKVESPFEQGIRLVLECIEKLIQDPQDQISASSVQQQLKIIMDKYKKNILIELFQKKLFACGIYQHQEFSLKLFHAKKRNVEKLVESFKTDGVKGILGGLISQLYIKLDRDAFEKLIRDTVSFIGKTIYDGNTEEMLKLIQREVSLEIYEPEEDDQVEFEKVIKRRKLEKNTIIIDDIQNVIYWTKDSFETLVQQVKKYQENKSLSFILELICKVREQQEGLIIDVNSVGLEELAKLPPELREKFAKLKSENEAVRSLISQGFNTNSFHFILEFIQNADDSEYLQDGVLEFVFDSKSKSLKIYSNECGFTYDNLYALSGIADSDKVSKKLETQSIGEKGIGFKTIFSICDKVHLTSNGFNVILTSTDLKRKEGEKFSLREGTSYEIQIQKFDHSIFNKYTLLTLKNIRKVIFKDDSVTTTYSLTSNSMNGYEEYLLTTYIQLASTSRFQKTTQTFYGFSIDGGIDMKNVFCEKRANFHRANLMIFFPRSWNPDERYKLHSYLPVKEDYNLPLLIQSDFILSQNREALIEDSEWNITIIDNIPQLLVQAFNSMKDIGNWKYGFFKMLRVDTKLHFEHIPSRAITLLKDIECIPVFGCPEVFEKPSEVILMGDSPLNPFSVFGIEECTKILKKVCVEKLFESDGLPFKEWGFNSLNNHLVISLAKNLPAHTKLQKSVELFKLFKHFKVNVDSLDFEIIPTKTKKLMKPSEKFFDGYEFSKGALLILEKASYYSICQELDDYNYMIDISRIRSFSLSALSKEELFVILAEQDKIFSNPSCLTHDGNWLPVNQCYLKSEHTNYLKKAPFVDITTLNSILQTHQSTAVNSLLKLLKQLGVKSVPILFEQVKYLDIYFQFYKETPEFTELRKIYPTLESLIGYFDDNFPLFEDQLCGIHYFLNCNIQNLYDPSIRHIFGDTIDYLPSIKTSTLKSGLTARKEDVHAYYNLITKSKDGSKIVRALKSKFSLQIRETLKKTPLLKTKDGNFAILNENLFSNMDARIQIYRPEWKEIDSNYKYNDIISLLRDITKEDYITVLKECNPTYEDQEYFIEKIINLQSSVSTMHTVSINSIHVTIDGNKKIPLSKMFWDLPMRELFPVSINEMLLAKYFTSPTIKKVTELKKDIKSFVDLSEILKNHLDTILDCDISKLDEKEQLQFSTLVSNGFEFSIPAGLVWNLYELVDIPFFSSLDLSKKFNNFSTLVQSKDKNKERVVSKEKIKEYLQLPVISDEHFLKVWKYCKRTLSNQTILKFIFDNNLIVCHNQKHRRIDLYKYSTPEMEEHFPHLNLLKVNKNYDDFEISHEIPIHIICKEIEKLENNKDSNEKCLILYKEIDRQIREGKIKDAKLFEKFKIYRNDKGKHFSKMIYYCDDEERYKQLDKLVDCLFIRDTSVISHFLQFFNIPPLTQKVSFKNPIITVSNNNFDNSLEKFKLVIQTINKYLSHKKFTPKDVTLQIVKTISVTAISENGNSSEISPEIHSDIQQEVIYIHESIFKDDIFQEKRFISYLLQFYPQIEDSVKDVLKLIILCVHQGSIDVTLSLIVP